MTLQYFCACVQIYTDMLFSELDSAYNTSSSIFATGLYIYVGHKGGVVNNLDILGPNPICI